MHTNSIVSSGSSEVRRAIIGRMSKQGTRSHFVNDEEESSKLLDRSSNGLLAGEEKSEFTDSTKDHGTSNSILKKGSGHT